MANTYFRFKEFTVHQDRCAMKVTTDACLFGAWAAGACARMNAHSLLDIGTGTGLLSLMIAQQAGLLIDAVELDAGTAAQAKENISASPFSERIEVVQADILHWPVSKNYDLIISNPPFYENELASNAAGRNRAHHSSDLNLSQVLEHINMRLNTGGRFFLLLPFKRKKEIEELLQAYGLHPHESITVCPSTQHDPFRLMITGSKNAVAEIKMSTLSIRNEAQAYTEEFTELLKPYYLYL